MVQFSCVKVSKVSSLKVSVDVCVCVCALGLQLVINMIAVRDERDGELSGEQSTNTCFL